MSKCYSCQTIGDHKTWCIGHIAEPKTPIPMPTVPEDATVPQIGEEAVFWSDDKTIEDYAVKDSGDRQQFASGMVRDTQTGKADLSRVYDGPMLYRWANHVTKAEKKYPDIAPGVPNWTLASGQEELIRFKKSAARHFYQWMHGDTDEDHAAAVMFNINGAEYVRERMK